MVMAPGASTAPVNDIAGVFSAAGAAPDQPVSVVALTAVLISQAAA